MRLLHVVGGLLGLLSGAVALYAVKGGKLHRRSGMLFVCAMLVFSASAAVLGARRPNWIAVIAGGLATRPARCCSRYNIVTEAETAAALPGVSLDPAARSQR